MKSMKKLAAVLLTAVMALSLLTACGGGGGGASNGFVDASDEFTKAINNKLETDGSGIKLTYNEELSKKTAIYLNAYYGELKGIDKPTNVQLAAADKKAFEAAGLDPTKDYVMTYQAKSPTTYGPADAAGYIAPVIEKQAANGKKAVEIGYMTLLASETDRRPIGLFMIIKCE